MRLRKPTALGAVCGVLTAVNLLNNRFAPRAAVPTSVVASALLIAVARRAGTSWDDLGLSRTRAIGGLRHGAVAAGGVGLAYAAGAALPATRPLFADERAADSLPGILRQALVDVPLGTVLLEETAFRGVLPALLRDTNGHRGAELISAGLFGLWHILPSGDLPEANPALAGLTTAGAPPSRAKAAIGAIVTTTIGGGLFTLLRRRSGSLVAPMALHTAFNSLGYLMAWQVNSVRTDQRRSRHRWRAGPPASRTPRTAADQRRR
ncbi:CPBP family intramembrane glutamic endopeptidase [Streptomyces gobiensis]|uniref:CPBP family intramembrane glutamic endopeptidase n=1 Tax=Streptomyces gobiensis TaxID=2875706 RepID=UPI001E5686DE|nr:CPBP family intramembrane glutamic endopeptidase [Streptomyces gobiensis]UGY90994.1 CPBP family intramembrane metalloprotease [Streptomyces gobiensis]